MEDLKKVIDKAGIEITRIVPSKPRPIYTTTGQIGVKALVQLIEEELGDDIIDYPEYFKISRKPAKLAAALKEYAEAEDLLKDPSDGQGDEFEIPDELKSLTLNVEKSAKDSKDEFFVTTENEYISKTSGRAYLGMCGIPPQIAYKIARPVFKEYKPRSKKGVTQFINTKTKEEINTYNTYIPPEWSIWKEENPKKWDALPAKPPALLMKLLRHLIPIEEERKYFYAWLYASITGRSYVYLVLCGAPGAGKNRLKLVMKALHGRENTNDGKKSTLIEKFNSQLSEGTLTWFDELRYNSEMENVMKELQNDYLSIEKKGVDATSSSTIHSSMVISNNKPRDNFIAFDARKFAPLVIGNRDLNHSMTPEEIARLTEKVEEERPGFDVKFVAQIAKWILQVGENNFSRYKNLEYRGPMFWSLAHTSMTRWQKKAVTLLMAAHLKPIVLYGGDEDKNKSKFSDIVWSEVEEKDSRRHGDKSSMWPDFTSVKSFLEAFRDSSGDKVFETRAVREDIFGDFRVKVLKDKVDLVTEFQLQNQRGSLETGGTVGKKTKQVTTDEKSTQTTGPDAELL